MEFYTYIWRDANGVPFYVGKGKGRRANSCSGRSAEFIAIYGNGGCTVEIVDMFIHESQAHAHEIELIALYVRRDMGGVLINKTDGGEGLSGFIHSDKTRAEMRASRKNPSAETRAKISATKIGKPRSVETRAKISAAKHGNQNMIGHTHGHETVAKMRASKRMLPAISGYKGVSFDKARGTWRATIKIRGKQVHLGAFTTAESAAIAYDTAAYAAFGDDCYLNFKDRVAANGNTGLDARPQGRAQGRVF